MTELAGVGSNNWVVAEMHAAEANAYINTIDRTQFRLYFPQAAGTSKLAGWNSAETTDNEPHLIVRYE